MYIGIKHILVLLFSILKISGQEIRLSPKSPAIVREGQSLNFTCQPLISDLIFLQFADYSDENGRVVLGTVTLFPTSQKCEPVNEPLICDFASNTFVLTLVKPVHNHIISCEALFNRTTPFQSNSTVSVQVPVSEVILSPSTKVEVNESNEITFTCLAKGSRPISNITWYRQNIEVSVTSLTILPVGSLFDVKSVLTTSFNKEENGSTVYCTANNIGGVPPRSSEKAVINVIYAPSRHPELKNQSTLPVDEGHMVTLQCSLDTSGNPPIKWSWMCGDDNLTDTANNTLLLSTLTFTANRTYDKKKCNCRATSPRPSLVYNVSSNPIVINVFYAPSLAPNLYTNTSFPVDENQTIYLGCSLPTSGNPRILWSWVCGGNNLTNEARNNATQTTLTFKANRKYDNRTCQCWATSPRLVYSYNMSSNPETIIVHYAPLYAPKLIANTLTFDEGQPVTLICSVDTLGNPHITWSWICGDINLTSEATNTFLQSILKFTANRKYNQRTCKCWAVSPKLSLSYSMSSQPRTINVYFAVNITNVSFPEGSNNMTAGYPLRIRVEIFGNPSSTVSWKIRQSNELIMENTLVFNVSEFQLDHVTCLHTNDYILTASNRVGNMSLKHFSLNVLCAPYLSIDNDPEPVVVGDEKQFGIKQNFIANPKPIVVWEKVERYEGSIIQNGSQHVTIFNFVNGKVNYTTILQRKNVTISDVGAYKLYLENGLGNSSSITDVIFKRRPDIPSNVSVTCSEPFKARVSWIAEFDGGGNQSFLIAFSQSDWNSEKISPVLTSGEKGEKFVMISDLLPNIEHRFKVYAKNTYGNVSTKSVSCKIIDSEGENSLPLIASTVAGSLLVMIMIIVTTIFFFRRRGLAYNKARNSNVRLDSGFENEENDADGDGLKENSLYVSAGPRDTEKPEVAVYAAVAKKVPRSDNNSNLYADVKKSTRKDTSKGTVSSEVKPKKGLFKKDEKAKHKKAKKSKNRPGETDVYENSEDIALSTNIDNVYSNAGQKGLNKQEERGYKNKDGLLYVEVKFDGKQGQDNPVIHGEDEKTDYATVEFPMPSALHKASGSEEL